VTPAGTWKVCSAPVNPKVVVFAWATLAPPATQAKQAPPVSTATRSFLPPNIEPGVYAGIGALGYLGFVAVT
jgi:hypothetical protein